MHGHKFDSAHLERLNDPERLRVVDPELLWKSIGLDAPAAVADLGAGTGLFALALLPKMAPGGKIWACDVAEPMVEWMLDHLPKELEGRVLPLLVEESHVELPDSSLDLVYCISVYHELARPEESLRDVLRLLRPGGTLAIADWRKEPTPHGPPLAHRVAAADIVAALRRAGFAEVRSLERFPFHSLVIGRR
jgi:ubiquinone/menaquinone biosynthesis C-methylase UbiE